MMADNRSAFRSFGSLQLLLYLSHATHWKYPSQVVHKRRADSSTQRDRTHRSLTNSVASSLCLQAMKATISGDTTPIMNHFVFRTHCCFEPFSGTLRCSATQAHNAIVINDDVKILHDPLPLGSDRHEGLLLLTELVLPKALSIWVSCVNEREFTR